MCIRDSSHPDHAACRNAGLPRGADLCSGGGTGRYGVQSAACLLYTSRITKVETWPEEIPYTTETTTSNEYTVGTKKTVQNLSLIHI